MFLNKTEQQDIVSQKLYDNKGGLIIAATGFGKTRTIITTLKLLDQESTKVLKGYWVVSSVLTRDVKLEEELIEWNFGYKNRKMKIIPICYESLSSEYSSADFMVMDEVHNITINNTQSVIKNRPEILIACTGTMPTREDKLQLLEDLKLDIVYSIDVVEAKEKGYVNDFELFIYKITLDEKIRYLKGWKTSIGLFTEKERFDQIQYIIRVAYAETGKVPFHLALMRKRFLQTLRSKETFATKLIKQIRDAKLRHIIFCAGVDQADKLCPNSYHYQNKDPGTIEDFNEKYIDSFSCIKAMDESHNLVDVDCGVILNLDKDATTFLQRLGRFIRKRKDPNAPPAKAYIIVAKDTVEEKWMEDIIVDRRLSTCKINYYDY